MSTPEASGPAPLPDVPTSGRVLHPLTPGTSTEEGVVLAVDIGGTFLKGGLVRADGGLVYKARVPTRAQYGPGEVLEAVEEMLDGLAREAEVQGVAVTAVGIAVPGIIDEGAGLVQTAANLGWHDFDLANHVEARFDVAVTVRQDVRAAALAEFLVGAAKGTCDFVFVNLGTGVSAALVLGGELRNGAHGRQGEIGHLVLSDNGDPCGCGGRGCLETISSAPAVVRRYVGRGRGAALRPVPSASELMGLATNGDRVAAEIRHDAVTALATVLGAIQMLLDLELIVIGGGMALVGEALLGPLAKRLGELCPLAAPPRLSASHLGAEAGLLGAGLAAWGHPHLGPPAGSSPTTLASRSGAC